MDRIVLPDALCRQMLRHAERVAPLEAVGVIGGRTDGRAEIAIELPNVAGPYEFLADPYAQYQAEMRIHRAKLEVIAIYHSHPGGGAAMSESDRVFAERWPCVQIVLVPDKAPGDPLRMRAYRMAGPRELDVPIIRVASPQLE